MALKMDQKDIFGRPVRVRCAVPPKSANPTSKAEPVVGKTETNVFNDRVGPTAVDDDVARKAKRQTCYECGEKDHLSSSCPNRKAADVARAGNETDDVAFDNVGDGKVKRRTCYECGEKGHLSSLCPKKQVPADVAKWGSEADDVAFDNVGDGKLKRRTCYECGEKGHLSSSCPKKQADADVARWGSKADDVAFAPTGTGNGGVDNNMVNAVSDGMLRRRTCYECGERGHLSSLCPKKQDADVADKKEANVMEVAMGIVGNVSDGKLRRRSCYECGERGHLSSLCPKKQDADVANEDVIIKGNGVDDGKTHNVNGGKIRRRTCYECGEKGHLSSMCPNKKAELVVPHNDQSSL